jgi:hypothetical protein
MSWLILNGFLGRAKHHRKTLVDRFDDSDRHGVGGMAIAGADPAAALQRAVAAALVAHELVDHPGRDAGASSQVEKV